MKLEGKVAIVTGAGRGLGQAIALILAEEGADIVVNDIDIEAAGSVADEIKSLRRQARAIKADVSNSEDVSQMVKDTLNNFKKIDILVNNAGIASPVPTEELTETEWDATININLKGPFLCCQAVGRQMIKQKRGKVINITSTAAHRGAPRMLAYNASKGGLLLFTESLAVEWAKYNINVNAVSPGFTLTPMNEKIKEDNPDFFKNRLKATPLGQPARPKDIANAVLFLASSESDFITGQVIVVDGGTCALHPAFVQD